MEKFLLDVLTVSLENEDWSGRLLEMAASVAETLRASSNGNHIILEAIDDVVDDILLEIVTCRFDDFYTITRYSASGTTCDVRLAFLSDEFRLALTDAANKSLKSV